jgi:hypothetical protein
MGAVLGPHLLDARRDGHGDGYRDGRGWVADV